MLLDVTDIAAAEHYVNLQISASQVGLRVNKVNYHRERPTPKALEELKVVKDFKYLGAWIALFLSHCRQQRGIAWSNFWKLQVI